MEVIRTKYQIFFCDVSKVNTVCKIKDWINDLYEMGYELVQICSGITDKKQVKFITIDKNFEQ